MTSAPLRLVRLAAALTLAAGLSSALSPATGAAAVTASLATPKPVLPWVEDDWTRAQATAKARRVPIFVESWAPW